MGEFLSEPIEDKNTNEGICCQQHDLIYVTSTMQGWRKNMEDMHTVECNILKFPDYSFFGLQPLPNRSKPWIDPLKTHPDRSTTEIDSEMRVELFFTEN
ncbi:8664_t:CDS:2 [Rhizophagus irregularis]|nr:8664_t:CDS:2 [Rhizophagus irregularis]